MKHMVIKNRYNLGDIVRLKTDNDSLPRMITVIQVIITNTILYGLSCGETTTFHYEAEITKEEYYEFNLN